jgi:F-type H+-transporting ATPase subunit delta
LRDPGIARNYAEALFTLGERAGASEEYGALLGALAGAITSDEVIRLALETPRVPRSRKVEILRRALAGRTPEPFQRWVEAVVRRGRQALFDLISREFHALLDVKFNRVHAGITLARPVDPALQAEIVARLSAAFGKTIVPHFREDPALLGGVVVRVGDRVIDGSVRRRMAALRRQILGT